MAEIKLVIFDCDGVLIDSELLASKAELEIYSEFGIEMDAREFAIRFAGTRSEEIKIEFEKELGHPLPDDVVERTRTNVTAKTCAEAEMVSGADAVLDQFDQARCVCSNSEPDKLKKMLSRAGLYDRFRPYVYSARDFDPPAPKPKPDMILRALAEFKVEAAETLVIEDSTTGIAAALNAGTRVIGFTGGSHTFTGHADRLIEAGAETVITRFDDLPTMIKAMSEWEGLVN